MHDVDDSSKFTLGIPVQVSRWGFKRVYESESNCLGHADLTKWLVPLITSPSTVHSRVSQGLADASTP
jgi:hypothetical protein